MRCSILLIELSSVCHGWQFTHSEAINMMEQLTGNSPLVSLELMSPTEKTEIYRTLDQYCDKATKLLFSLVAIRPGKTTAELTRTLDTGEDGDELASLISRLRSAMNKHGIALDKVNGGWYLRRTPEGVNARYRNIYRESLKSK